MKKLELKHLVYQGYTPLKVVFEDGAMDLIQSIDYFNGVIEFLNNTSNHLLSQGTFKLELKPLEEYLKIEEITDEMTEFEMGMIEEQPDLIERISYEAMQKMFKHHIDIWGLINQGLAIKWN